MSRGFPSMTALLGLLAVAGYQHRDKIAEMLGGLGQSTGPEGSGRKVVPAASSTSSARASAAPVPAGSWAADSANSWTALSRAAMAKLRSPGLERAPTNPSRRPNSNRRSAPTC